MTEDHNQLTGGLFLTAASFIFMVSGYLINIWLGRVLGPASYGVYGVIISLMTAVNIIQTSGLPQATSKFIAGGRDDIGAVLRASLIIQIVSTIAISAVFFILAYPIAFLLKDLSLTPYIQATSLILPFYGLFALYIGYYNGLHNFKRQALMNSVYGIAKLVLVVGLVYVFHIYGAIAGFVIAPIVALVFGFRVPARSKSLNNSKRLYPALINFSLPLIGFAVLSTLIVSIDLFFVKALVTDAHAAGLYTAAQNVARIPFFALSAFAIMLYPIVSRSIQGEHIEETSARIQIAIRYLILLLIPATAVISSTSTPLLHLLYGTAYISAAPTLALLTISLGFITLFVLLANVLNAAHRGKLSVIITASALIITIVASFALIPHWGLVGGAAATGLGGFVALFATVAAVERRFPRSMPWRSIMTATLASIPLIVIPSFIDITAMFLPLLYIFLGLLYGLLLMALQEISSHDLNAIKALLPRESSILPPND
jgi:stage V sporulation protein B